MKRLSLHRLICLLLAGVVSSLAALSHAAEASVWKERRNALSARNTQVAALPGTLPFLPSQNVLPPVKSSLTHLPLSLGALKKPAGFSADAPAVFHIQDIHQNTEAQKNISGALQSLLESQNIDLIAVEGAWGDVAISELAQFPDRPTLTATADFLLKQNDISAPVHALMISAAKVPLVGVDDAHLHAENVRAYQEAARLKTTVKSEISARRATLEIDKAHVFNPALRALDQKLGALHRDESNTGARAEALREFAGPQLKIFLEAYALEQALDYPRAEQERNHLLNTLAAKISAAESADLMRLGLGARSGENSQVDLFVKLRELAQLKQVSLGRYPHFVQYMKYAALSEQLDGAQIHDELRAAEAAALNHLARNDEERALLQDSRRLNLTEKLVDFALTKNEWAEFKAITNDELRITGSSIRNSEFATRNFEDFYRAAEARDRAMSENLRKLIEKRGVRHVALITGGFHSIVSPPSFKNIEFIPRITRLEADSSAYLTAFTQKKTPLDQLFKGEKLFLAKEVIVPGAVAKARVLNYAGAARTAALSASENNAKAQAGGYWASPSVKKISERVFRFEARRRVGELMGRIQKIDVTFDEAGKIVGLVLVSSAVAGFVYKGMQWAQGDAWRLTMLLGVLVAVVLPLGLVVIMVQRAPKFIPLQNNGPFGIINLFMDDHSPQPERPDRDIPPLRPANEYSLELGGVKIGITMRGNSARLIKDHFKPLRPPSNRIEDLRRALRKNTKSGESVFMRPEYRRYLIWAIRDTILERQNFNDSETVLLWWEIDKLIKGISRSDLQRFSPTLFMDLNQADFAKFLLSLVLLVHREHERRFLKPVLEIQKQIEVFYKELGRALDMSLSVSRDRDELMEFLDSLPVELAPQKDRARKIMEEERQVIKQALAAAPKGPQKKKVKRSEWEVRELRQIVSPRDEDADYEQIEWWDMPIAKISEEIKSHQHFFLQHTEIRYDGLSKEMPRSLRIQMKLIRAAAEAGYGALIIGNAADYLMPLYRYLHSMDGNDDAKIAEFARQLSYFFHDSDSWNIADFFEGESFVAAPADVHQVLTFLQRLLDLRGEYPEFKITLSAYAQSWTEEGVNVNREAHIRTMLMAADFPDNQTDIRNRDEVFNLMMLPSSDRLNPEGAPHEYIQRAVTLEAEEDRWGELAPRLYAVGVLLRTHMGLEDYHERRGLGDDYKELLGTADALLFVRQGSDGGQNERQAVPAPAVLLPMGTPSGYFVPGAWAAVFKYLLPYLGTFGTVVIAAIAESLIGVESAPYVRAVLNYTLLNYFGIQASYPELLSYGISLWLAVNGIVHAFGVFVPVKRSGHFPQKFKVVSLASVLRGDDSWKTFIRAWLVANLTALGTVAGILWGAGHLFAPAAMGIAWHVWANLYNREFYSGQIDSVISPSIYRRLSRFIYPMSEANLKRQKARVRRAELIARLSYEFARTDVLTGLPNRRRLEENLPAHIAEPDNVVIFFDLNNFGQTNKELNDDDGDLLLQKAAKALDDAVNEHGLKGQAYRKGGDEFVILAPRSQADAIRTLAETLFGETALPSGLIVSMSGAIGKSLKEADEANKIRKRERKASQVNPLGGIVPKLALLLAATAGWAAYQWFNDVPVGMILKQAGSLLGAGVLGMTFYAHNGDFEPQEEKYDLDSELRKLKPELQMDLLLEEPERFAQLGSRDETRRAWDFLLLWVQMHDRDNPDDFQLTPFLENYAETLSETRVLADIEHLSIVTASIDEAGHPAMHIDLPGVLDLANNHSNASKEVGSGILVILEALLATSTGTDWGHEAFVQLRDSLAAYQNLRGHQFDNGSKYKKHQEDYASSIVSQLVRIEVEKRYRMALFFQKHRYTAERCLQLAQMTRGQTRNWFGRMADILIVLETQRGDGPTVRMMAMQAAVNRIVSQIKTARTENELWRGVFADAFRRPGTSFIFEEEYYTGSIIVRLQREIAERKRDLARAYALERIKALEENLPAQTADVRELLADFYQRNAADPASVRHEGPAFFLPNIDSQGKIFFTVNDEYLRENIIDGNGMLKPAGVLLKPLMMIAQMRAHPHAFRKLWESQWRWRQLRPHLKWLDNLLFARSIMAQSLHLYVTGTQAYLRRVADDRRRLSEADISREMVTLALDDNALSLSEKIMGGLKDAWEMVLARPSDRRDMPSLLSFGYRTGTNIDTFIQTRLLFNPEGVDAQTLRIALVFLMIEPGEMIPDLSEKLRGLLRDHKTKGAFTAALRASPYGQSFVDYYGRDRLDEFVAQFDLPEARSDLFDRDGFSTVGGLVFMVGALGILGGIVEFVQPGTASGLFSSVNWATVISFVLSALSVSVVGIALRGGWSDDAGDNSPWSHAIKIILTPLIQPSESKVPKLLRVIADAHDQDQRFSDEPRFAPLLDAFEARIDSDELDAINMYLTPYVNSGIDMSGQRILKIHEGYLAAVDESYRRGSDDIKKLIELALGAHLYKSVWAEEGVQRSFETLAKSLRIYVLRSQIKNDHTLLVARSLLAQRMHLEADRFVSAFIYLKKRGISADELLNASLRTPGQASHLFRELVAVGKALKKYETAEEILKDLPEAIREAKLKLLPGLLQPVRNGLPGVWGDVVKDIKEDFEKSEIPGYLFNEDFYTGANVERMESAWDPDLELMEDDVAGIADPIPEGNAGAIDEAQLSVDERAIAYLRKIFDQVKNQPATSDLLADFFSRYERNPDAVVYRQGAAVGIAIDDAGNIYMRINPEMIISTYDALYSVGLDVDDFLQTGLSSIGYFRAHPESYKRILEWIWRWQKLDLPKKSDENLVFAKSLAAQAIEAFSSMFEYVALFETVRPSGSKQSRMKEAVTNSISIKSITLFFPEFEVARQLAIQPLADPTQFYPILESTHYNTGMILDQFMNVQLSLGSSGLDYENVKKALVKILVDPAQAHHVMAFLLQARTQVQTKAELKEALRGSHLADSFQDIYGRDRLDDFVALFDLPEELPASGSNFQRRDGFSTVGGVVFMVGALASFAVALRFMAPELFGQMFNVTPAAVLKPILVGLGFTVMGYAAWAQFGDESEGVDDDLWQNVPDSFKGQFLDTLISDAPLNIRDQKLQGHLQEEFTSLSQEFSERGQQLLNSTDLPVAERYSQTLALFAPLLEFYGDEVLTSDAVVAQKDKPGRLFNSLMFHLNKHHLLRMGRYLTLLHGKPVFAPISRFKIIEGVGSAPLIVVYTRRPALLDRGDSRAEYQTVITETGGIVQYMPRQEVVDRKLRKEAKERKAILSRTPRLKPLFDYINKFDPGRINPLMFAIQGVFGLAYFMTSRRYEMAQPETADLELHLRVLFGPEGDHPYFERAREALLSQHESGNLTSQEAIDEGHLVHMKLMALLAVPAPALYGLLYQYEMDIRGTSSDLTQKLSSYIALVSFCNQIFGDSLSGREFFSNNGKLLEDFENRLFSMEQDQAYSRALEIVQAIKQDDFAGEKIEFIGADEVSPHSNQGLEFLYLAAEQFVKDIAPSFGESVYESLANATSRNFIIGVDYVALSPVTLAVGADGKPLMLYDEDALMGLSSDFQNWNNPLIGDVVFGLMKGLLYKSQVAPLLQPQFDRLAQSLERWRQEYESDSPLKEEMARSVVAQHLDLEARAQLLMWNFLGGPLAEKMETVAESVEMSRLILGDAAEVGLIAKRLGHNDALALPEIKQALLRQGYLQRFQEQTLNSLNEWNELGNVIATDLKNGQGEQFLFEDDMLSGKVFTPPAPREQKRRPRPGDRNGFTLIGGAAFMVAALAVFAAVIAWAAPQGFAGLWVGLTPAKVGTIISGAVLALLFGITFNADAPEDGEGSARENKPQVVVPALEILDERWRNSPAPLTFDFLSSLEEGLSKRRESHSSDIDRQEMSELLFELADRLNKFTDAKKQPDFSELEAIFAPVYSQLKHVAPALDPEKPVVTNIFHRFDELNRERLLALGWYIGPFGGRVEVLPVHHYRLLSVVNPYDIVEIETADDQSPIFNQGPYSVISDIFDLVHLRSRDATKYFSRAEQRAWQVELSVTYEYLTDLFETLKKRDLRARLKAWRDGQSLIALARLKAHYRLNKYINDLGQLLLLLKAIYGPQGLFVPFDFALKRTLYTARNPKMEEMLPAMTLTIYAKLAALLAAPRVVQEELLNQFILDVHSNVDETAAASSGEALIAFAAAIARKDVDEKKGGVELWDELEPELFALSLFEIQKRSKELVASMSNHMQNRGYGATHIKNPHLPRREGFISTAGAAILVAAAASFIAVLATLAPGEIWQPMLQKLMQGLPAGLGGGTVLAGASIAAFFINRKSLPTVTKEGEALVEYARNVLNGRKANTPIEELSMLYGPLLPQGIGQKTQSQNDRSEWTPQRRAELTAYVQKRLAADIRKGEISPVEAKQVARQMTGWLGRRVSIPGKTLKILAQGRDARTVHQVIEGAPKTQLIELLLDSAEKQEIEKLYPAGLPQNIEISLITGLTDTTGAVDLTVFETYLATYEIADLENAIFAYSEATQFGRPRIGSGRLSPLDHLWATPLESLLGGPETLILRPFKTLLEIESILQSQA